jgi:hypothetical protein
MAGEGLVSPEAFGGDSPVKCSKVIAGAEAPTS